MLSVSTIVNVSEMHNVSRTSRKTDDPFTFNFSCYNVMLFFRKRQGKLFNTSLFVGPNTINFFCGAKTALFFICRQAITRQSANKQRND